jgi:hypothetical protein
LVIRLYLKPLLDALACADEKSPVRIATTTPGKFNKLLGRKNPNESWSVDMFCTFLDAGDCPVNMACSSAEEYPKRGLCSSLAGQYPKRDNFFPKNTLIIIIFL